MYPFKVSACRHISTTDKLANNLSEYKLLLVYNVIPSKGNNPAAPLTPHNTVMPSTSCKHGKE